MKKLILITLLSMGLFANTQPYKKEILLESLNETKLIQVSLDNEFYQHTSQSYSDVRLHSSRGVEGYFIKEYSPKHFTNKQRLKADIYDREHTTLTYFFKKAFELEQIELHIEDRNFESKVDVYIDDVLFLKNSKIFDYTNETGSQNFIIKLKKIKAKKVSIVYHLDETTSFYKKYKNINELTKYLTIKSATFSNNLEAKEFFNSTIIMLDFDKTEKKTSSYIFKSQNIPFSKMELHIAEKNFKRSADLYASNDGKTWQYIKRVTFEASSITKISHKTISQNIRTKYIMLKVSNQDNNPLHIESIKLFSKASYLYFLADKSEQYSLYFGDKRLEVPSYELKSLLTIESDYIEAKLGKMEKLEIKSIEHKYSFFEENKDFIFILTIFLSILILSYIAFGLLKKEEG